MPRRLPLPSSNVAGPNNRLSNGSAGIPVGVPRSYQHQVVWHADTINAAAAAPQAPNDDSYSPMFDEVPPCSWDALTCEPCSLAARYPRLNDQDGNRRQLASHPQPLRFTTNWRTAQAQAQAQASSSQQLTRTQPKAAPKDAKAADAQALRACGVFALTVAAVASAIAGLSSFLVDSVLSRCLSSLITDADASIGVITALAVTGRSAVSAAGPPLATITCDPSAAAQVVQSLQGMCGLPGLDVLAGATAVGLAYFTVLMKQSKKLRRWYKQNFKYFQTSYYL